MLYLILRRMTLFDQIWYKTKIYSITTLSIAICFIISVNSYGETSHLEYSEIKTKNKPEALIIFLHGLGGNSENFLKIIPKLKLPNSTYSIIPQAPKREITINKNMIMPAWYNMINRKNFGNESENDIFKSSKLIHQLINKAENIVPANKIFLIGFSQGGVMALYSGLTYPKKLGGIVCLSGYIPINKIFAALLKPQNKDTKIFMAHGKLDNIIPIQYAESSYELLKKLKYDVHWRKYPMVHIISSEELDDLSNWLLNII